VSGCSSWDVTAEDSIEHARVEARLDATSIDALMALFPFPHDLRLSIELREDTLSITTSLLATGEGDVPVAFGYHPYFRLPGVERSAWLVDLPVTRRAFLDERCLPTGKTEPVEIARAPLGDRTYDDLYLETKPRPVFSLAGGGRTISVAFGEGFPIAVIYAPSNDDVICFEPMTASTDPYAHPESLRWVGPGAQFVASFDVIVG
jgi:galactose mutarotase-like enzyme